MAGKTQGRIERQYSPKNFNKRKYDASLAKPKWMTYTGTPHGFHRTSPKGTGRGTPIATPRSKASEKEIWLKDHKLREKLDATPPESPRLGPHTPALGTPSKLRPKVGFQVRPSLKKYPTITFIMHGRKFIVPHALCASLHLRT